MNNLLHFFYFCTIIVATKIYLTIMKSNLLLGLLYSFMFFSVNGQKIEDFSNAKLSSSYTTGRFIGIDSIAWNYVNARGGQTTTANKNAAISLHKSIQSCIFSDTIVYGIRSLQFQYEQELTSNCDASVWINDSCIGQLLSFNQADITQYFSISNLSFSDSVVISIRQNTASSGQLTIDDIAIEYFKKPLSPFKLCAIEEYAELHVLHFSYPITYYTVASSSPNIIKHTYIQDSVIYIEFFNSICGTHSVCIQNITDTSGRVCADTCIKREFAYTPSMHEIIITEIMSDPSPSVGLPEYEYLELYNTSNCEIQTNNLQLQIGTELYSLPACTIKPHTYILLVSNKAQHMYGDSITVCAMSTFPSIVNSGETIAVLQDSTILSSIPFSIDWHTSAIKKDGGWALEKIDITNVSETQELWKSATNYTGGTPGYSNSISKPLADTQSPYILYLQALNDTTLLCKTSENIDPSTLLQAWNTSNTHTIYQCNPCHASLQEFELLLETPLQASTLYEFNMSGNLLDFAGNTADFQTFEIALFDTVSLEHQILITEILFNPTAGYTDFIELYNNSNSYITLSHVIIANRDSIRNEIGTFYKISEIPILFAPHTYVVISTQAEYYKNKSDCYNQSLFVTMPSLPSFPDEQGTVWIQNKWGKTIDSVTYSSSWHSASLRSTEGVSLERLNYAGDSWRSSYWQSASTLHGGMSPGCENTQQSNNVSLEFSIENTYISPNNDGDNDVLTITYTNDTEEKTLQMYVFSLDGELVKHVKNNTLLGTQGIISWDGTSKQQDIVDSGIYIVYIEVLKQGVCVYSKKFTCSVI